MKTGRNLQEVLVELNRQNQAKQDFISPAQGMRLREDGHTFEINHLTTNQQEVFGTTSLFHRQVASALGIPAKYYDLMQAQKPELLAENVNSWFADKPSSYMVRSMDYGAGQVARALLSERYRRIDNMEIATAVLPLFAGNDQYEVMSCEVTENRLYLKVVNHRLEMEVRKGDIVQAGVMISNSEVGLGAVSIQPLVYRLVCTNGMVVNDMGERRHHVGRQAKAVEDSFALYSDETMEAEDKAFLLKLRDTTMAAIDEARFSQVVGRLQESMEVPITGKVQDVVQLTAQSYGINAVTWRFDWIQQNKRKCYRFAEILIDAKEHRLVTDREEKENFVDLFVRNAVLMPEPNRKLIDCMYEAAWYSIYMFKYGLDRQKVPAPWYDTKEHDSGKGRVND